MSDWGTISALATAGGTLVLAVATFVSVRSANRAARTAERAFAAGLRPVLFPSRFDDPKQLVNWVDEHVTKLAGGRAAIEVVDEVVYMAMSLRNVGSGIAVLHGWKVVLDWQAAGRSVPDPQAFRHLNRDLYVPPGDIGFWQGAIREADDPDREALMEVANNHSRLAVEVLYGDLEGGQRTITRFGMMPIDAGGWVCTVSLHMHLDRDDPR